MVTKRNKKIGKVGVLMGGPSTEREISLKSGKAVCEALLRLGLDVVAIDITTDRLRDNLKLIKSHRIDCAFVALHGRFGEDGQIQEILESIKLIYTGSGVNASKLAMDKVASRKIFEVHGLPVPKYKVLDRASYSAKVDFYYKLKFPLVVKPASHGSSIGISFVAEKKDLPAAVERAFGFDDRIIVEEFIKGRELTVGILDNRPLPVIEIVPKRTFFDYDAKYSHGLTEYIIPAQLDKAIGAKVQEVAQAAHRLLGCFGCSRVDIILDEHNTPYVLEVNSIPGLTSTSLLPKAAKVIGIEFEQLCLQLLKSAYEKA